MRALALIHSVGDDGSAPLPPRAGVRRILREFESREPALKGFAVVAALERCPELVQPFVQRGDEIACYGLRWIHSQQMPESDERAHVAQATARLRELTGGAWPLGRDSPRTRRLVADAGGYVYDGDDLVVRAFRHLTGQLAGEVA